MSPEAVFSGIIIPITTTLLISVVFSFEQSLKIPSAPLNGEPGTRVNVLPLIPRKHKTSNTFGAIYS